MDTIQTICKGIKDAHDLGAEIAIVVGGGNFWRCLLYTSLFQEMGRKCKGILAIFRLNRLNQAVIVYFLARR